HDPANIILDEPTNGLDVLATRALRDSLRWLRTPEGGGKCIVFSTHIMQEVERLCDSVVVVVSGRSVAHGTVAELLDRTGQTDFEEAFVQLAFGTTAARDGAGSKCPGEAVAAGAGSVGPESAGAESAGLEGAAVAPGSASAGREEMRVLEGRSR